MRTRYISLMRPLACITLAAMLSGSAPAVAQDISRQLKIVQAAPADAEGQKRDVRGVVLGMDHSDAVAVLKKQGATCKSLEQLSVSLNKGSRCMLESGAHIDLITPSDDRFRYVAVIDYEFPSPTDYNAKRQLERAVKRTYGLRENPDGTLVAPDHTQVMITILDRTSIFFSNSELRHRLESRPPEPYVPPKF